MFTLTILLKLLKMLLRRLKWPLCDKERYVLHDLELFI